MGRATLRLIRTAIAAVAPLAAAGCGGGLFLGFEFGDVDDGGPNVSLAASPAVARPGETVQLVAAASDASGIDNVQFFRIDGDVAVTLGADGVAPFQWAAVLPPEPAGSVRFFARATDGFGHRADSNVVAVTLAP